MGKLLGRFGVRIDNTVLDSLWRYHQLLRANNHDQDLTRLIGFETIVQRHYADCMILQNWLKDAWPEPIVDIGTGAGFPGLMIKLLNPKLEIILAEPRPRRVAFLEMCIRELNLENISVFPHKVTSKSLVRPIDSPLGGSITRAFDAITTTLPRLGSALGVGSRAIFMKGPQGADEVREFKAKPMPGWKLIMDKSYRIQGTTLDRLLIILEKTTPISPSKTIKLDDEVEVEDEDKITRSEDGE